MRTEVINTKHLAIYKETVLHVTVSSARRLSRQPAVPTVGQFMTLSTHLVSKLKQCSVNY